MIEMVRHSFLHDGLTLSYLDTSGDRPAVVALHGHMMEALTFAPLADALAPDWRVIALDQRGHGHSDHADTYTRDDYLGDIAALYRHLGLESAVLLGNSFGGANAYQFAARHPESVRALVIEDIGAIVADDISFVLPWGGTFPTRDALEERIGPLFASYFMASYRQTRDGWKLAFDPRDMVASQAQLNGDHWDDWLASKCPALLIRGRDSKITTATQFEEMAAQRPLTTMVTLNGGHVLHADDPAGFVQAVRTFVTCL
jgi:esterase